MIDGMALPDPSAYIDYLRTSEGVEVRPDGTLSIAPAPENRARTLTLVRRFEEAMKKGQKAQWNAVYLPEAEREVFLAMRPRLMEHLQGQRPEGRAVERQEEPKKKAERRQCQTCGKLMPKKKRPHAKYCSDKCRAKGRRKVAAQKTESVAPENSKQINEMDAVRWTTRRREQSDQGSDRPVPAPEPPAEKPEPQAVSPQVPTPPEESGPEGDVFDLWAFAMAPENGSGETPAEVTEDDPFFIAPDWDQDQHGAEEAAPSTRSRVASSSLPSAAPQEPLFEAPVIPAAPLDVVGFVISKVREQGLSGDAAVDLAEAAVAKAQGRLTMRDSMRIMRELEA